MNAVKRASLPDWPRLMSVDLAADYVGIGQTKLRKKGPAVKRIDGRVLYDRLDLDRWVDALGGQPLNDNQRKGEGEDLERRILARLGNG